LPAETVRFGKIEPNVTTLLAVAAVAAVLALGLARSRLPRVDGEAVLYLDRGGTSLQTLPAFDDPELAAAATTSLRALLSDGRVRELVIAKVDGLPIAESPHRAALLDAGFVAGYRGLVLRAGASPPPTPWAAAAGSRR